MASKLNRAAELVGDAVGTVEAATAGAADRIEKRTKPIRKTIAAKATSAKKVAKKRAAPVKRKATSAKKRATSR